MVTIYCIQAVCSGNKPYNVGGLAEQAVVEKLRNIAWFGKKRSKFSMLQEITPSLPKDIIAKAIYSKLLGLQRNDSETDIDTDLSTKELSQLLARFILYYGQPPGLNSTDDFKVLRKEFAVALRHKEDQSELCLEVAKQSLEKGIPYVTYGVSPAARFLKNICKEVVVEVNQAKSLRFCPHPDQPSIYWADYNIRHNTADLILKYFSKRYPMRILVIYSRRDVFWLKDGQVFGQDIATFSLASIDPKFEEHTYYRAAR